MNDFDFEELDEAVNALAAKTHGEHDGPDPVEIRSAVPTVPAAPERPVPEAIPGPVPVPRQSEVSEPAPVPVVQPQKHTPRLSDTRPRRRGAFMDIVPPISRSKQGIRVGVSLQPVNKPEDVVPKEPAELAPSLQEHQPVEEPPKPVEAETPTPPEVQTATETSAADVAWPDPLDFHDGGEVAEQQEKREETADSASPFLAEAKVEKRPLGAFSNFRATPEKAPADQQVPVAVKDELTPEANGTFKEPEPTEPTKKEKAPTAAEAEAKEEPAKPDMHSAAMMSIPQQYRTGAKVTDKTTHSIFDTKEYHPPLIEATSPEHRGGGMWGKLFIALIVLALLGVAGYFTYLYVTQR